MILPVGYYDVILISIGRISPVPWILAEKSPRQCLQTSSTFFQLLKRTNFVLNCWSYSLRTWNSLKPYIIYSNYRYMIPSEFWLFFAHFLYSLFRTNSTIWFRLIHNCFCISYFRHITVSTVSHFTIIVKCLTNLRYHIADMAVRDKIHFNCDY